MTAASGGHFAGGQPLGGPVRARRFMMASVVAGLQLTAKLPAADWRTCLASVDLTPEHLADGEGRIPLEQGLAAFEAVAAWTGRSRLGIDYATAFAVGGTGPLGFAAINAKSVRQSLQTIARFMPMVASLSLGRYEEDEAGGSIVWQYPVSPSTPRLQYVTWGIAVSMRRLAPALPAGWHPQVVELDFPKPRDRSPFDDYFGPGLRFDRPSNRFSIEAELLDRPPPAANSRLFELMTRLAEIEQRQLGVCSSVFEAEARARIGELLREGRTTAAELAAAMGMELSRLRRTLKQHDLDFRTLIDDVRKEAARNHLLQTDVSITEIAFALGYSDSSIFTRACHKWFGQAPRDVRARAVPN